MNFKKFKSIADSNHNRNCMFVKIKEDRVCKCCGASINKGTTCLTTNSRVCGRQWICDNCVESKLKLQEIKAEMKCVPFGDEGYYMALQDEYNRVLGELEGE